MNAARQQRWMEAESAFLSGLKLSPRDPRFMVELAGVAFKQQRYARARKWLERALQITPGDAYTLDFLATIFYLEGNLEAALKYWNRVQKPHIESVTWDPHPRLDPVLLDRAFAFSPASVLELGDLRTTQARIQQLDVFSSSQLDLQARPAGSFDVIFHAAERNGCGNSKWECLLRTFGELPGQTINFAYFNLGGRAVNFRSRVRFDAEKRRFSAQLEAPVLRPKWSLGLGGDVRNENWGIRSSFSGAAPLLAALNLQRQSAYAEFTDVISGRWQWSAATEFSNRSYQNVLPGNLLAPELLRSGHELKQSFSVRAELLRIPERRFTVSSGGTAGFARLWATPSVVFSTLQASVKLHWFPQQAGEKYEIQQIFRAGKTFGDPPFDELFMLGALGDSELPMRAHIATRDGKKGSAPLGREYFLANWEATRDVSPVPLLKLRVGPFVDTGTIRDPIAALGSQRWLWDVGLEARLQLFGFGVTLSYARDLRTGRNAVVAASP
ncbi:MAG TPA: tetratricopeptide repeat protein [Terriglobales bacterium]|nr:tetratricopeptide repeat protein [Terriglobales bacterium]